MITPWGMSQTQEQLDKGVWHVTTAGHGGFLIGKGWAKKHLSAAGRAAGSGFGSYLAYEEDLDWMVLAFETMFTLFPGYFFKYASKPMTEQEQADYIHRGLSRWNPEYLIARSLEPSEPEYSNGLRERIEAEAWQKGNRKTAGDEEVAEYNAMLRERLRNMR